MALRAAGLFAGIGGVERGFAEAGIRTELLCEVWDPARAVLAARFPGVRLEPDVRSLHHLPPVDVLAAGFPCTDLSQAGRTAGIGGAQSGLVAEVFRLLDDARTAKSLTWLVFENVRNMLALDRGRAMAYLVGELEARGFRWAYRLVDSRFTGVPQRRQRVLMVASRYADPRTVVLADDAGEPEESLHYKDDAYGFYWTEGLRGLGWARDAVPTLKGGSTVGIPSPPAIWLRTNDSGRPGRARFVTPSIADAEALQGFPRDWTLPAAPEPTAAGSARRNGPRWRLVGNAVTVGVAAWLGGRLETPGRYDDSADSPVLQGDRWPTAAWGEPGRRARAAVSMWPRVRAYSHLTALVDPASAMPLSRRAAAGFLGRTTRAKLRFDEEFLLDLKRHVAESREPGESRERTAP